MTINTVLARLDAQAQSRSTPHQAQVGHWLREAEDPGKVQARKWQGRWLTGAVTLSGLMALVLAQSN